MSNDGLEDGLTARRSRRSTAGNRYKAALAEVANEYTLQDAEDDIDFSVDKYEESIADSDFESTDEEEEAKANEIAAEEELDEEKQARKSARARVAKSLAASRTRPRAVSIDADSEPSSSTQALTRTRRKAAEADMAPRQSKRRTTVMNTTATAQRVEQLQKKRAAKAPRKIKRQRQMTQDELLARALANEAGNITEHRDYLKLEEEKRKRARVVRKSVEGPLLRWISRTETKEVIVPQSPTSPPPPPPPQQHDHYMFMTGGSSNHYPHFAGSSVAASQTFPYQYSFPPPPPPPPPAPVKKMLNVEKNYLVHELGQRHGTRKPNWNETMTAVFGDHVKWGELKVFRTSKPRPLSRIKQTCPLTGLPAPYRDPRTGTPYANKWAYDQLTKVLMHEYEWNPALGCYVWSQMFEEKESEDEGLRMDTS